MQDLSVGSSKTNLEKVGILGICENVEGFYLQVRTWHARARPLDFNLAYDVWLPVIVQQICVSEDQTMQAAFVHKNFVNLGISQITRILHKTFVSSLGEPILINFILDQKSTLGSQSPQFSVLKAYLNVGVLRDSFPKLHII